MIPTTGIYTTERVMTLSTAIRFSVSAALHPSPSRDQVRSRAHDRRSRGGLRAAIFPPPWRPSAAQPRFLVRKFGVTTAGDRWATVAIRLG